MDEPVEAVRGGLDVGERDVERRWRRVTSAASGMRASIARRSIAAHGPLPTGHAGRFPARLRHLRPDHRRPGAAHRRRREQHRVAATTPPGRRANRCSSTWPRPATAGGSPRTRRRAQAIGLRALDPARRRPRADRVLRPARRAGRRRGSRTARRAPSRRTAPATGRSSRPSTRGRSLATSRPASTAGSPMAFVEGGAAARSPSPTDLVRERDRPERTTARRAGGDRPGACSASAATSTTPGWRRNGQVGCTAATGEPSGYALSPDRAVVGRAAAALAGRRSAGPAGRRRDRRRGGRPRDDLVRHGADGHRGVRPPARSWLPGRSVRDAVLHRRPADGLDRYVLTSPPFFV